MKKNKISENINRFAIGVWQTIKNHPAEIVILLYTTAILFGIITESSSEILNNLLSLPLYLTPLCFVTTYTLSQYQQRGMGWRVAYWLPLALFFAALLMPFVKQWSEDPSYFIVMLGIVPLWMLLRRFTTHNDTFSAGTIDMTRSLAIALFFSVVAFLLFALILLSIELLFDIKSEYYGQVATVLFVLVAPILFITFDDRNNKFAMNKLGSALVNWVVSPALLIYTMVLYIYAAKILITRTLPNGSVAIMISVFCLLAMLMQLSQLTMEKRPFGWYYRFFSLIALPLIVLFWVGVARRLSDYGLTPTRYWLVFCGGLMTLYVLLFLVPNRRGYYLLTALAATLLLVIVAIPPLTPERMSDRSQIHRIRTIAAKVNRLKPDGTLLITKADIADTAHKAEFRKIYQSLVYFSSSEKAPMLDYELGVTCADDFAVSLSEPTCQFAKAYYWEFREEYGYDIEEVVTLPISLYWKTVGEKIDLSGAKSIEFDELTFWDTPEVLNIAPDITVTSKELLDTWFEKCGSIGDADLETWCKQHTKELLVYKTDKATVIFDNIDIYTLENNELQILYAKTKAIIRY